MNLYSKIKFSKKPCYDSPKLSNLIIDEYGQWEKPNGKTYRVGKIFYLYYCKTLFWFSFFDGYGLHGKNFHKRPLLFSERNGYRKFIKIGKWRFGILKPSKT